ncbi:MAG: phosphate regulon sensor histidine kinase PhoR [Halorhodospira halophila]|uniref:phosphate regulon sensor histidine kinase PhoR n=1 Tax=Halorhodospira TaxID=85108 RepID=UPI0019130A92|nr:MULTISPECIES: phosphate regulon sensor histidine kinase PhoR [Halorhodospira]MBK5942419.1 PAS domain-containing sensor histidine kinase [Halorhodospira halophila]MCC3751963.1 phosphate regulon sensor histidine kinase PhoR [Halorhodospira halophila]MCG5540030.1 phosphate regulon sensor histidine kinase PhoR [Halorhodospira sp. M39old]MCG5544838.1 phosphate regulon sensor histidine kinase PhoR [Halorhodospira sp. M38]
MTRNPWPGFLLTLLAALAVWLIAGLATGWWVEAAAILLALGYLWNQYQLWRLERWLRVGRKLDPPISRGVWGEVFHALHRRQRRQRERRHRLRRVIREYRESAKAMPDATMVLYADDRLLWWNNAARELLGLTWPGDEGQRISNLLRQPEFRAFLDTATKHSAPLTMPSPVDPRITLELRLVPYGRNQRLLIARDISRTQRLETIRRDFVANVSHELKTPLTVIYGVAEEMGEELAPEQPGWAGSIRLLQEQSARMQRLVQDLLTLSRLETGSLAEEEDPVDMQALLEEVCAEARTLSGDQNHRIELEAEPGLFVRGSYGELRSAVANLVSNAVRYTPGGGAIRVRWQADAHTARCEVADSGIGIPREHLPRITERFYRVDKARSNATGGTGLGLAIVKHVMHRHGGWLNVRSEPDQGSTFTLVFPARTLERDGVSSNRHPAFTSR